jgi:uncharacterized membrane protein (UPF0127 family)
MTKYLHDQNIKATLTVAIADTPEKRAKGLAGVIDMDDYSGLLFKYPSIVNDKFWGRGLLFDIDIAFISDRGEIVDIRQIFGGNETSVTSSVPFSKALEVNLGFFQHHGISVGHRVIHKGTTVHIL